MNWTQKEKPIEHFYSCGHYLIEKHSHGWCLKKGENVLSVHEFLQDSMKHAEKVNAASTDSFGGGEGES
jgi:hypothetical protein